MASSPSPIGPDAANAAAAAAAAAAAGSEAAKQTAAPLAGDATAPAPKLPLRESDNTFKLQADFQAYMEEKGWIDENRRTIAKLIMGDVGEDGTVTITFEVPSDVKVKSGSFSCADPANKHWVWWNTPSPAQATQIANIGEAKAELLKQLEGYEGFIVVYRAAEGASDGLYASILEVPVPPAPPAPPKTFIQKWITGPIRAIGSGIWSVVSWPFKKVGLISS